MTQTLRRERIQKFKEVFVNQGFYEELLKFRTLDYGTDEMKKIIKEELDNDLLFLYESLADASISRSEIAGEYKAVTFLTCRKCEYQTTPPICTKCGTPTSKLPENSDIAFLMANEQGISQTQQDNKKKEHDAIMAFESAFGISTTSWAGKWFSNKPEWNRLRKWVTQTWLANNACFDSYITFKKGDGKFLSLMDAPKIARNPDDFYTSWDVFVRENSGNSDKPQGRSMPNLERDL